MDIKAKINMLYDKDSSNTVLNFKELMEISENTNILYPYFDEFKSMIKDERYLVRLKSFRLLCKQSKWDIDNKIDDSIDFILTAVDDEKPTAIRQKIQALEDVVLYKPYLGSNIKQKLSMINILSFNENMQILIIKDIQHVIDLIAKQNMA